MTYELNIPLTFALELNATGVRVWLGEELTEGPLISWFELIRDEIECRDGNEELLALANSMRRYAQELEDACDEVK